MEKFTTYSGLQRKLHWIIVAIVAVQFMSQSSMKSAMDNLWDGASLTAFEFLITTLHTWGGTAAGAIMVYRLKLRMQRPVPAGAGGLSSWQSAAAAGLHWSFYAVLFFMALTGTMHYYLEWHTAAQWHRWGKWLLLGLILAHVVAALLHRFYKKDAVMSQMWGSGPPH